MAVISKSGEILPTGKKFVREIKYSKGNFYIEMPEDYINDLGIDEDDKIIHSPTEKGVIDIWDVKMRVWKEARCIKTKVIIFRTNFEGGLYTEECIQKNFGGHYTPAYVGKAYARDINPNVVFLEGDLYNNVKSLLLEIVWGVYMKTTINGKDRYEFLSGRPMGLADSPYRNKKDVEIPWSIERENWFLGIDEAFSNMISKVHSQLANLDSEKLTGIIDSNIKLLN